jgi:hypothetical protein
MFSKKATVPLSAITDQYLFSEIFPNYLSLLFMTMAMFGITISLNQVFISMVTLYISQGSFS